MKLYNMPVLLMNLSFIVFIICMVGFMRETYVKRMNAEKNPTQNHSRSISEYEKYQNSKAAGFVFHNSVGINSRRFRDFNKNIKQGALPAGSMLWILGMALSILSCLGLVSFQKK